MREKNADMSYRTTCGERLKVHKGEKHLGLSSLNENMRKEKAVRPPL